MIVFFLLVYLAIGLIIGLISATIVFLALANDPWTHALLASVVVLIVVTVGWLPILVWVLWLQG